MNRIFYPIMLMAYGFFVMGMFARADGGEMRERNLLRDVPRAHLTQNNTERSTASSTEKTIKKSSVEGDTTEKTTDSQTGT